MTSAATREARKTPWLSTARKVGLACMLGVILLELATRLYFAIELGPRMLLYGTRGHRRDVVLDQASHERAAKQWEELQREHPTVEVHENRVGGYTKFFPNEARYHQDVDTHEVFRVNINRHGFRGDDFVVQKAEGTIRVVTLGASSTFGFYNRDHETYPSQLEEILNRECPSERFEVINLGIPHLYSDAIRLLFMQEALPLDPDIVTFYEGRNDTGKYSPEAPVWSVDGRGGLMAALAERLLFARFVRLLISQNRRVEAADVAALREQAPIISKRFLQSVELIARECRRRGIIFIPITQQANSKSWFGADEETRARLKGVTLAEEVAAIEARLRFGESIGRFEAMLLIHHQMQQDLRRWAREEQLPLVDAIEELDDDRHYLVSWVHLHPKGNAILANALARKIIELVCAE